MERKLPKNIRQIGNVSDNPKVYVEDYVDTFINQMCEKAKEEPIGAFLIGETFRKDDNDYIFIHGAVQMQDIEMRGNEVVIGDKTWKKACEEGKRHFAGNTILGWFMTAPGLQVKLNNNLIKLHERLFMKKSRVLILKDSVEKEEAVFVYKYNDLMHIGGHYIYYEKNPGMQDYMISKRKQNCVTPSESVEDRATKDFRSIIKSKEEQQKVQSKSRYTHMASSFLLLILLVIGIVSFNHYDGLQVVQSTIGKVMVSLSGTESENGDEIIDVDETIGNAEVIEVVGVLETEVIETMETEESGVTEADDVEAIETDDVEVAEIEETQVTEAEGSTEEGVLQESNESINDDVPQGDEDVVEASWTYTVKEGDSLAQICKDIYGSVKIVEDVCMLNGLEDSDYIYIGQKLRMP